MVEHSRVHWRSSESKESEEKRRDGSGEAIGETRYRS